MQGLDAAIGPVADRIDTPAAQSLVRQGRINGLPLRAIFAQKVSFKERETCKSFSVVITHYPMTLREESFKFRAMTGEVLKPGFSSGDRCWLVITDAVNAVGKEQMSVRVHQPPFAVELLGAEKTVGLEQRARAPAPVLIPLLRPRHGGQFRGFGVALAGQVSQRLRLAGPVLVPILPKRVNERKERRGIGSPGGRGRVSAGSTQIAYFEDVLVRGLRDKE